MRLRRVAAMTAVASLAILGGCGQAEEKSGGGTVEQPAGADSSTTTTLAPVSSSTTATTAKATATTATTAKTVSYANCAAVEAAGKAPIRKGEPGYSTSLDRDGDGIACDQ